MSGSSTEYNAANGQNKNSIMLFGVRVIEGNNSMMFRKSASMNNLSQYDDQQPQDVNHPNDAGYASDDVLHTSGRSRERKRGVPWTEEEHKKFLVGLEKLGKGDWRGISRNFVKTRTPTQVASHAQKYFLRRSNHSRRRRRSSLFDITTDTFTNNSSMEEDHVHQKTAPVHSLPHISCNIRTSSMLNSFPAKISPSLVLPLAGDHYHKSTDQSLTSSSTKSSSKIIRPIPMIPTPPSSKLANLKLKEKAPIDSTVPLSLKLSTSPPSDNQSRSSSFPAAMSSSDSSSGSIISVA